MQCCAPLDSARRPPPFPCHPPSTGALNVGYVRNEKSYPLSQARPLPGAGLKKTKFLGVGHELGRGYRPLHPSSARLPAMCITWGPWVIDIALGNERVACSENIRRHAYRLHEVMYVLYCTVLSCSIVRTVRNIQFNVASDLHCHGQEWLACPPAVCISGLSALTPPQLQNKEVLIQVMAMRDW